MTIAETVTKLRMDAGLSIRELSERSGVPVSTIGAVERGTRSPRLEIVQRICQALKKSLKVFDLPK